MSDRKVAFVTEGTAEGCFDICMKLAGKGYSIGFTYSGEAGEAEKLKACIEASGVSCLSHFVKNFDAPELSNAIIETAEKLGGADLLVYFGDMPRDYETDGDLVLDLDEADWDETMNRGVRGFFLCCKYIVPYLISRPGARIIAIDTKPHDCASCNLAEFVASHALRAAVAHIATEMSFYGLSAAWQKLSDGWPEEL